METFERNWYVLHTYSGYENKVKANIESRAQSMGMGDYIFRVVVPEETRIRSLCSISEKTAVFCKRSNQTNHCCSTVFFPKLL